MTSNPHWDVRPNTVNCNLVALQEKIKLLLLVLAVSIYQVPITVLEPGTDVPIRQSPQLRAFVNCISAAVT